MNLAHLKLGIQPAVVGVITEPGNKRIINSALRFNADILELRIDCFKYLNERYLTKVIKNMHSTGLPIIATVRSAAEGGERRLSDTERLGIFSTIIQLVDAVDIELSSKNILKDVVKLAKRNKKKVIISYHNFKNTPTKARLKDVINKAKAAGGDIVKIATFAKDRNDLKKLALLTLEQNNIVTIAMGDLGVASRVFFPILGSLFTYGALSKATAPGQLPIKDLKKELNYYGFYDPILTN